MYLRENMAPELKDVQNSCSWIPTTPAKPDSTTQPPICSNGKEKDIDNASQLDPEQYSGFKHDNQANWIETGRLLNNLPQETQCLAIPTCYNSTNSVNVRWVSNTLQANQHTNSQVHGEDLCINDKFTINNNIWNNLSFGNLLAVAHAGATPAAVENVVTVTDSAAISCGLATSFHPQINLSFGNLSGAKYNVELDSLQQTLTGENSIPSMTMCNFHSPTRTNTNSTMVKSVLSLFEPLTPEKLGKAGCESAMSYLSKGEMHVEEDARVNKILSDKAKELVAENKQSQSCATNSTQLQENHKPDKEGAEETDLRKTPNPKPRKKRHRPKVIVEGQHKKTPKPAAENPAFTSGATKAKRKYVRRNGANNLNNTPMEGGKSESGSNKSPSKPSSENPAFSSGTTKVKRKYVRKKGVNHLDNASLEGVKSETDSNKSHPNSKDTPIEKRKYVRKKGINKPEASKLDEVSIDAAHGNPVRFTRNSCRRSLNFDLESQEKDEGSSYCPSSNQDIDSQEEKLNAKDHLKATMQCRHTMEVVMEKTDMGYQLKPERHSPNPLPYAKTCPLQDDYTLTDERVATRGKCQIVFSNVTHDKEENAVQMTTNPDCQLTSSIPNDSNCSNSKCLDTERNARTYKRQRVDTAVRSEIYGTNATGVFYNSLQTCSYKLPQNTEKNYGTPSMYFPVFCNTSRTETGHNTTTCSLQSPMMASGNHKNLEKNPLRETTTAVKEQSNMCNCNGFINLIGSPVAKKFRYVSAIDAITEQLNKLDLKAESNQVSVQDQSAILAYHKYYQEQHALVPYQRGGAVIPFDNSFDQVKRRRPRPKVELDDETIRVWQLLLENINSEGIDGNDEEKTKWWEEERRVFSGRADSFIARMHLVQGDRRFSPWKGSVLDSVIGVFLTQNVSDHLSSSAFMSLVAQFPLKSKTNSTELYEERVDTHAMEPEKYVLNPDETSGVNGEVLNKEACGKDSEILHEFEGNDIKVVSRVGSPGSSFDGIKPDDGFRGQLADMSKHDPFVLHTSALNNEISSIETKSDTVDALTSQSSVTSSHSSTDSPIAQTTERTSILSTTEEVTTAGVVPNRFINPTFVQLLQMAESNCVFREARNLFDIGGHVQQDSLSLVSQKEIQGDDWISPAKSVSSCGESTLHLAPSPGAQESEHYSLSKLYCADSRQRLSPAGSRVSTSSESEFEDSSKKFTGDSSKNGPKLCSPNAQSSSNDQIEIDKKIIENQKGQDATEILFQENNCNTEASNNQIYPQNLINATGNSSHTENSEKSKSMEDHLTMNYPDIRPSNTDHVPKRKGGRIGKDKVDPIDWDSLRKRAEARGRKREKTPNTMDSVDWETVRCADVNEIAHTIRERGMNNRLAERIKDFLNRLVRDHGSLDLEWLRDIPPDKAKEYLLSVKGLGLKSVECVRLLTLHHLAFPVDTNVGRIAVRLGWVPLQPLPESLQLHLLEMYPIMESIQKYLWPRLCKLDQKILYELHYQMITFGKVFCTKSKPNCNACPMRGECRHFASAFASARLALPAPEEKSITLATEKREANQNPAKKMNLLQLPSPQPNQIVADSEARNSQPIIEEPTTPEPTVEAPATPEPSYNQVPECDIENSFCEDPDEIPTIQLNMEEFTHNLQKIMRQNAEILEGETSKAIVALTPEAALIPLPKLKNVSQLRTEHQVYELPDSHPLLEGMDRREVDDPCPYLLAIWTPGETVNSIEPPERRCSSQEPQKLCNDETCLSCNSVREANSLTVRGTLLIPCRTAMRGSFPLNGTYFQVNEVFSDHESSLHPMDIPRKWLWNLPRRTVYFGTSIPTIFKGLATGDIQYCFWRGFVCVRGFDRKTRAPRPLIARLHFPASKLAKRKGEAGQN
ncbi:transcriptional activator DEMETER [Henckelia pumila]|uniref:transcriptional activator DEMETER n=1 Tax=Henckelia pumila TaxID=405737 RepID=UPI003C6E871D